MDRHPGIPTLRYDQTTLRCLSITESARAELPAELLQQTLEEAFPGLDWSAVTPPQPQRIRVGEERLFFAWVTSREGGEIRLELMPQAWLERREDPRLQALESRNQHLSKLLDAIGRFPEVNPHVVLRVSAEGRVLYSNPAARSLEGLIVFRGELDYLHQDLTERLLQQGQERCRFQLGEQHFEVSGIWVASLEAYNLYFSDITAELALEASREELRQFPMQNPNPVLMMTDTGRLLFANPAAEREIQRWAGATGEAQGLPESLRQLIMHQSPGGFQYQVGKRWYKVYGQWSEVAQGFMVYLNDITPEVQNRRILENLKRYFSPVVAESILSTDGRITVATSRKTLSVFFSDVVEFSRLSSELEPEILTKILFDYLTAMTRIAERHGGTVDKYIGDAIMVFFGDPVTQGVHQDALACARMALEMQEVLPELIAGWAREGIGVNLQVRMGMHSGVCTVGNFGSETRLDYTALGNGVNIAARLESAAEPGSIYCSEAISLLLRAEFPLRDLGPMALKNIDKEVRVFSLHRTPPEPEALYQVREPGFSMSLSLRQQDRAAVVSRLERLLAELKAPPR